MIDFARLDFGAVLRALGIEAEDLGRRWRGRCPNAASKEAHRRGDQNPSWALCDDARSEEHGVHSCWSCGYGGTILSLASDVRGTNREEAGDWLRQFHRDEGPDLSRISVRLEQDLQVDLRIPFGVVLGKDLGDWPSPPRSYLERRGVTAEQVRRWGLGYSVDGDLAGRIWVPKRDARGRLRSWNARTYVGEDPRYRNPKGAEGADKGAVFGEAGWPGLEERGRSTVVVTEGEFNALAWERAGAVYVGALGGASNRHPGALLKLGTFREAVLATDSDRAGDAAAEELSEALSCLLVRRARLPEGADAEGTPVEVLRSFLEG